MVSVLSHVRTQAGFGPGRPGKPGKDGKDGKPGTAGKKGKNGGRGRDGGKAWNVHLRLAGSDAQSLRVGGYMEYVCVNSSPKVADSQQQVPDVPQASSESVRQPLVLRRQTSKLPGST